VSTLISTSLAPARRLISAPIHSPYDVAGSSSRAATGTLGLKRPRPRFAVAQLASAHNSTHWRGSSGGVEFVSTPTADSKHAPAFPARASAKTLGRRDAKQPKSSAYGTPSSARFFTLPFFLDGGEKDQFWLRKSCDATTVAHRAPSSSEGGRATSARTARTAQFSTNEFAFSDAAPRRSQRSNVTAPSSRTPLKPARSSTTASTLASGALAPRQRTVSSRTSAA